MHRSTTTRKRTLTTFAAVALSAPFLSIGTAQAQQAQGELNPPPPQSFESFCQNVPVDFQPFRDVDGNAFEAAIECLAFTGVTQGGAGERPDDVYAPGLEVTRDAMATFVARVIDTAAEQSDGQLRELPPYDGTPAFSDIEGNTHEANISRLADAGIVSGGVGGASSDRYVPSADVTRAQMATFIAAAVEFMTGQPLDAAGDYYTDDAGSVHEPRINAITTAGISNGAGPDTYRPALSVDRGNMAQFLARVLGLLESEGLIEPAAGETPGGGPVDANVTDAPELTDATVESESSDTVTLRFSFDEDVSSELPEAALFHLYAFDASVVADGGSARVEQESRNDVLVTFDVDQDEFADVTVATVDFDAAQDSEGNGNLEGDAAVQPTASDGGTTTSPDLVEVRDFDATTDEVEFVFDEPVAAVLDQEGFRLVPVNANEPVRVSDAAEPDDDDPTVVHVSFDAADNDENDSDDNVSDTGDIANDTQAETARGAVLTATVGDETGDGGTTNPLQIVEVSNEGNSDEPDLVSVSLDVDNERATFTFDEPVQLAIRGQQDDPLTPDVDESETADETAGQQFQVYDRNGNERTAETVTRSSEDNNAVVAEFQEGELDDALGASVQADAVRSTSGSANRNNEVDEVPLAGQQFVAGLTTAPDLLETRVERGASGDSETAELRVVYVFDENVDDLLDPTRFFVYDEDGDRFTGAAAERNDQEQNEVRVTFEGDNDTIVEAAVAATVDDDAVRDEDGQEDSGTALPVQDTTAPDGTPFEDGNVEGYTVLQQLNS